MYLSQLQLHYSQKIITLKQTFIPKGLSPFQDSIDPYFVHFITACHCMFFVPPQQF